MRLPIFFAAGLSASLAFGWFAFPRLIYRTEAQPLRFSHKTHTGEKGGMKCDDCHALRADGTFSGVPAIEKCGGCHASQLGTSSDEKLLVEKYVGANREVAWKVYSRQPDNAFFSHAYHVKLAKIGCEECHKDHGKTDSLRAYSSNRISEYGPGQTMSDCERCHDRRGVRAGCLDCHK
jgi:menaquinone reductase, multiheme cytochrome c subunit